MEKSFVLTIGKPDFGAQAVREIHNLGFNAGLILGANETTPHEGAYDIVIRIDFSDRHSIVQSLSGLRGRTAGLITAYENYVVSLAEIGSLLDVMTIKPEAAKRSTDKVLMRQAFSQHCPQFSPDFRETNSVEDAITFAEKTGYPVMLKPANLVKSMFVTKCNSEDELRDAFNTVSGKLEKAYTERHVFGVRPKLLVESYLEGQMYTIAAYVNHAGEPIFCPGIVELTRATDRGIHDSYLYCRSLPTDLTVALQDELLDAARHGISALGLRSIPAHIELIATPSGVKIVEIGARTGGYRPRMYQLAYDINLSAVEVNNSVGASIDMQYTTSNYTAVYELFPEQTGTFSSIDSEHSDGFDDFFYYSIKAAPGESIGPASKGYKAALVVIVSTPDHDEFVNQCSIVDNLRVELDP